MLKKLRWFKEAFDYVELFIFYNLNKDGNIYLMLAHCSFYIIEYIIQYVWDIAKTTNI